MIHEIKLLDHGYLRLIETWGSDEKVIEAARQSTQKGFRGWGTPEKPGDEKLLRFLWEHEHSSPFEFAGMVVEVQAPLMVFREWHRHRTQSFSEASARYAPLPEFYYVPTTERLMMNADDGNKQAGAIKDAAPLTLEAAEAFRSVLRNEATNLDIEYRFALQNGVPKELARLLMTVGRYSRMRASANLRNWLAFVRLRSDAAAQWEIRQYSDALGEFIEGCFPRTWELFDTKLTRADVVRIIERAIARLNEPDACQDDVLRVLKQAVAESLKEGV